MIHPLRDTRKAILIAAAVVLLLFTAAPAMAAGAKKKPTPCWKTLINDWYDGRIDGTYPIHCYRDALKHLPADVDTYSSARDDIKQALQKRITQSHQPGGGNDSSTPPTGPGGGGGNGPTKPDNNPTNPNPSPNPDSPFSGALGKPANADSLPIPLLVLGGVALILMAAGAAGFLIRRQRLRRDQLASLP